MVTVNQNFNEIYKKYKNLVLKTAYQYSGDYGSADDIMQETFLSLYKDMQQKDFYSAEQYKNIKAWLITTAKHRAINMKLKAVHEVSIFEAEKDLEERDSEEKLIEDMEVRAVEDLHTRIMTALLDRNGRWHEAIFLVCYLGVNQDEAAKRMGLKKGAFHQLLHRTRDWIRKEFGVEYEELKND